KVTIALTTFAIFHAGACFADYRGRSRWTTLLLAPLAIGFTYYWGFVANLVGFAGLLYALPLLDRTATAPTFRRVVVTCVALVGLFFAHGSVFVIALFVLAATAMTAPTRACDKVFALTPAAFGALLWRFGAWRSGRLTTGGEPTYATYSFPLGKRLV